MIIIRFANYFKFKVMKRIIFTLVMLATLISVSSQDTFTVGNIA